METRKIKVNAAALVAASQFIARNDVRYYLQGICIEPTTNGAVILGTDGHALLAFYDEHAETGGAAPLILGLDKPLPVSLLNRADDTASALISVAADGTYLIQGAKNSVVSGSVVDGTYPKWRAVLPRNFEYASDVVHAAARASAIAFNPEFMSRAERAMKAIKGTRACMVSVHLRTAADSFVVDVGDARVRIIVMPMRDGSEFEARPFWVDMAQAKTPEQETAEREAAYDALAALGSVTPHDASCAACA